MVIIGGTLFWDIPIVLVANAKAAYAAALFSWRVSRRFVIRRQPSHPPKLIAYLCKSAKIWPWKWFLLVSPPPTKRTPETSWHPKSCCLRLWPSCSSSPVCKGAAPPLDKIQSIDRRTATGICDMVALSSPHESWSTWLLKEVCHVSNPIRHEAVKTCGNRWRHP